MKSTTKQATRTETRFNVLVTYKLQRVNKKLFSLLWKLLFSSFGTTWVTSRSVKDNLLSWDSFWGWQEAEEGMAKQGLHAYSGLFERLGMGLLSEGVRYVGMGNGN